MREYVIEHGGAPWCVANDGGSHTDYLDVIFTADQRHYADLMTWVEENFDCAGL
jgi:hypothetical protein